MKIKNILYVFLWISIVMASDIRAMERPNKQQTEKLSRKPYHSNLPLLLWCGRLKNDESCLNWLPPELIIEIIKHITKIQNDQNQLNIRNDWNLLEAADNNDEDEVKRLLNEPYIDVNVKDEDGNTALNLAVKNNNPKIVQTLLNNNANPNIPYTYMNGFTALIVAVRNNNPTIVQMLLDEGANPYIQDHYGCTALHRVTRNTNSEIVQMLLDKGANPNIQDIDGWTALFGAVTDNRSDIVQMLLDAGANIDIRDKDGDTALDLAVRNKNLEIIKILEANKPQTKCIIS